MSSSNSDTCSYNYSSDGSACKESFKTKCGSPQLGNPRFRGSPSRSSSSVNSGVIYRDSGCDERAKRSDNRRRYTSSASAAYRKRIRASSSEGSDECHGSSRIALGKAISEEHNNNSQRSGTFLCERKKLELEEDYYYDSTRHLSMSKADAGEQDRLKFSFVQNFSRVPPKRRIIHDVYEKKYIESLVRRDYRDLFERHKGAVFIVCDHNDHYHVVHDCTYHNYSCRCSITQIFSSSSGIGKRYSRRVIASIDFSIDHWINLAVYFERDGRFICCLDLAGRNWIPGSEAGHIQFQQDCRNGKEKLVEGSGRSVDFYHEQCTGSEQPSHSKNSEESCDQPDFDGRSEKGGKAERIIQWLKKFPVSPVNHIFSLPIWLTSPWRFFNRGSPLMGNILKIHSSFYNELSVEELYTHFMSVEPQYLIFNSPYINTSTYYYSIEESIDILEKLVSYQFFHNEKQIKHFYTCLFDLLDKKVPKKNSMFILSPPNAGKNFFFDCVVHYCINFGQMGNFNRYCTFPLMECVDKRIILWNEPCMEASATETLKCILGGDSCNAKVKYQGDAVIMRTPVIILSNNDIFPKNEAFRSRMYQFNWRPANFLVEYKLKPHPLCIYHLFNKYKNI